MKEFYFKIPKTNKPFIESMKKVIAFAKKEGKGLVWAWEDAEVFTIHTNNQKLISYLMQFKKA